MKKIIVAGMVFAMVLGFIPTTPHLSDYPAVAAANASYDASNSGGSAGTAPGTRQGRP